MWICSESDNNNSIGRLQKSLPEQEKNMSKLGYKDMASYKGFDITKSFELSLAGKPIPNTARYTVSDSDEDWIGDVYKTLKEAHRFIDEYILGMGGVQ